MPAGTSVAAVPALGHITVVQRRGHPYGTVILGAVTYRVVAGVVVSDLEVADRMVGVMVIAVLHLDGQFGPARKLRQPRIRTGSGPVARIGRKGRLSALIGLSARSDAQTERIVRRSVQPRKPDALRAGLRTHGFAFRNAARPVEEIDLGNRLRTLIGERTAHHRRRGGHLRVGGLSECRRIPRIASLPGPEGDRFALHAPCAAQLQISVHQVVGFGFEVAQMARKRIPAHLHRLGVEIAVRGSDPRVYEPRAALGQHAVGEFRAAGDLRRRSRNHRFGFQEPCVPLLRAVVSAGGETCGNTCQQNCQ